MASRRSDYRVVASTTPMASTRFGTANQGRQMASPRPKTRDSKDTLCRNVLIYGHCRYEDQGCAFNHDQNRNSNNSSDHSLPKKSLNVDSPSFTPAQLGSKKSAFSTNAAPFTPRGGSTTTTSPSLQQESGTTLFKPTQFSDFTQNNYDLNSAVRFSPSPLLIYFS